MQALQATQASETRWCACEIQAARFKDSSIHLANLRSLANKSDELQLLTHRCDNFKEDVMPKLEALFINCKPFLFAVGVFLIYSGE